MLNRFVYRCIGVERLCIRWIGKENATPFFLAGAGVVVVMVVVAAANKSTVVMIVIYADLLGPFLELKRGKCQTAALTVICIYTNTHMHKPWV